MRTKEALRGDAEQTPTRFGVRLTIAILISTLGGAYTVGVVSGLITDQHRIDVITLGVIAIVAGVDVLLLRPKAFEKLRILQILGFKLEMLEERQGKQQNRLEEVDLILPLLLPERERKHIVNLADGRTSKYKGNHELRSELRRLRSIGIIEMCPTKEVNQMRDESLFDLADYVKLTKLGVRWAKWLGKIDQTEVPTLSKLEN